MKGSRTDHGLCTVPFLPDSELAQHDFVLLHSTSHNGVDDGQQSIFIDEMELEAPALSLSDVLHHHVTEGETLEGSDDELVTGEASTSKDLTTREGLRGAADEARYSEDNLLAVEMLERELASLLNQGASSSTLPDDNTDAAGDHGTRLSGNGISDPSHFCGLVEAFHAAHLQARQSTLSGGLNDNNNPLHPNGTKSAPAFHSLNEDREGSLLDETDRRSPFFGQGSQDAYPSQSTSQTHPGVSQGDIAIDPALINANNFNDISDFLAHLTSQLEGTPPPPSPKIPPTQAPAVEIPLPPPPVFSVSLKVQVPQILPYYPDQVLPPPRFPRQTDLQPSASESRTYSCEQCQKTFGRRSDMTRHTKIHSGDRPFVCPRDNCGKTFIQRTALQVHMRVHTGERPHVCEYPSCNKSFADSSSLARHRRTHTGKRPYRCEEPSCDKTFTRRTTLTTHMRTHDPNWEPDPNIKYNFKAKRPRIDGQDNDDDLDLEESVRTLTSLLRQSGAEGLVPAALNVGSPDEPLEARVAAISAEIAAAIAQAQANRGEEDEDDEEDENSDSDDGGSNGHGTEILGPAVSGVRDEGPPPHISTSAELAAEVGVPGAAGDSADLNVPLRPRGISSNVGRPSLQRKRKR